MSHSGSLTIINEQDIERVTKAHNYQMFRHAMLTIMTDVGVDTDEVPQADLDKTALVLLRSLLGEDILEEYINELLPPRTDLN